MKPLQFRLHVGIPRFREIRPTDLVKVTHRRLGTGIQHNYEIALLPKQDRDKSLMRAILPRGSN